MNKLQNSKEMFKKALSENYGIGAFNFVNMEVLKAILAAAEEQKSPVIVQASLGAIKYAGVKELTSLVAAAVSNVTVPVCLNLDHANSFEDCKLAIDHGFTSVMIDASALSFEENITLTKKVVEYAKQFDVSVEAELGVLAGVEEHVSHSHSIYTDPDQAEEFVKRTNVDSLAIAIGTSHGAYKFKGNANLDFDTLKEIQKRLPSTPLVLHGASSVPQKFVKLAEIYGADLKGANGVPEELLEIACKQNICKINVDSDLKLTFTASLREHLHNNPENIDLRKYNSYAMKNVKDVVANKMKLFGSANRA